MLDWFKNELRAKRNALLNMAGRYSERRKRICVERVRKFDLIDDWMDSNNAVFIHIPKAAGRSVQHALEMPLHRAAHIPAESYRRAAPQFYTESYIFSIIRNPWDRLVSSFHFMHSSDHHYNRKLRDHDLRGSADFELFLSRLRNPLFRHQILTRMHFMPQAHYLCDEAGQIIVDRIGRFEHLPASFAEIAEPLRSKYALERRNSGVHKDYRSYFTKDWQIQLVGNMYAADCSAFGYSFDQSPTETIILDRA